MSKIKKNKNKHGWWSVEVAVILDDKHVDFVDLTEDTQEHIFKCMRDGFDNGEIIEEGE